MTDESNVGDTLLVELLRAGKLAALGEDDLRLKLAEQAAEGVTDWLLGTGRPQFPAALLSAIDEDGATSTPPLEVAYEQLLMQWPAMPNVFPEQPTELLRGILLQAVMGAAGQVEELKSAAWYLLRTASDVGVSIGTWVPVIDRAAKELSESVDTKLAAVWSNPPKPATRLTMPAVEVLDQTAVPEVASLTAFHTAVDPQAPQARHPQIGEHLGGVLDEIVEAISTLDENAAHNGAEKLKAFSTALGKQLRGVVDAQWALVEVARIQQRLLWWRLGGYSQQLGKRYDEVDDLALRAVAAAVDIYELCPPVAPVAVEHLLRDAIATAGDDDTGVGFVDLAAAWDSLSWSSPNAVGTSSPALLLDALITNSNNLPVALGSELSVHTAAVVVFRDLQIRRLSIEIETAAKEE